MAFGAVALDVFGGGRLAAVDDRLARELHAAASPGLVTAMRLVSALGSTWAIGGYAAVAATVLALMRQRRDAVALSACIGGGLILNAMIKLAFQRPRPVFDDPLLMLETYSFPSGHVAASTLFCGLAVAWVGSRTRLPLPRSVAAALAVAAIGLVAYSRVLLGAHYLSDVVAAVAEGIAWLALCLGAVAAQRGRRVAAEP